MLLVDTSYLIFYRIYALKMWFSKAKPDFNLEVDDLTLSDEFLEKFRKTFPTTLEKIMKRFGAKTEDVIFLRDCTSSDVWRKQIYPEYKSNRDYTGFNGKKVFQWTYDNILPDWEKKGAKVLRFDQLEADDIAAIIVNWMSKHNPAKSITIVTNDNDYLQLLKHPQVSLINLKEEDLKKRSIGNPEWDLMKKIILGDPSDNIPKVLDRCGEKTLIKYLENPSEFQKALDKKEGAKAKFKINQLLIDFEKVPKLFTEDCISWCNQCLST